MASTLATANLLHCIHIYDNLHFWTPYDFEAALIFGDYSAYLLKEGTELFSFDFKKKLKLNEPTFVIGMKHPLEHARATEKCRALFGIPQGADYHTGLRQTSLVMHILSCAFEKGYALSGEQMKAIMAQKEIPKTPRLKTSSDS